MQNTIDINGYTGFSCHNCTIFDVYPKIFIDCTIFAKFVSHFSGRDIPKDLQKLLANWVFIVSFCKCVL